MNENIQIDANHKTVIAAITDDTDKDITNVRLDPITKRVKTAIEPLDSAVDSVTINIDNVFQGYGLFAYNDDDTNLYICKQNEDGKWIIKKIENATGETTYAKGDTDASTN